jgi:hemoglobin
MLMTGRYKGTPMKVHAELPGISEELFRRWLALFRATAHDVCPGDAARLFVDRSERIAESLQLGIALHRGDSLVPAGRPRAPRPGEPANEAP